MNPEENTNPLNFNSNQPTGNGIFGSPASNTANGAPVTTSTLNVPVASPTHFDQPAPVPQPIVPTPEEAAKDSTEKTIKKFTRLSIVLGIFAVIFLGLSIWGLIYGISSGDQLTKANQSLAEKSAIISAVEEAAGTTISSPADVPTFKTTHGYIYLDEWGIKIKVPEDLTAVSYILNENYRPSICFNAYKRGTERFPAFADIAQNPGGMGCLVRVATSEGAADQDGRSFGTQVATIKGYNYFYVSPQAVFSADAAEQGLELTAVQSIKNMLSSNNISQYE